MTNKKELELSKTYDIAKPAEAVSMAVVLKNIVVNQGLYTNIMGKNYAHVEGWMLAGMLTGISVIVEEPKDLSKAGEIKYSATAKLYQGDKLVGIGYALCSSKETKKKSFDEYAILSMAQTRAIGKAYRNKIGFIMKLAGFQATPSEEMHKAGEMVYESTSSTTTPISQDLGNQEAIEDHVCLWKGCGKDITAQEASYSIKLYKRELCRAHQAESKKK
jgi:hypothetical protein